MYDQNFSEQIAYAEISLEEAKKIVAFGEAIARLEKNRDFKLVFLDGYFTEELKRLVFLTADPALDEKFKQETWSDIRSIAGLRQFLLNRKAMGEVAAKDVLDHTETVDELRQLEAQAQEA